MHIAGTYDCLVTSGGMGECHIPCAGLNEMLRITKPGVPLRLSILYHFLKLDIHCFIHIFIVGWVSGYGVYRKVSF